MKESNNISNEEDTPTTNYIKQGKKWKHKLFECPTFWKSVWNTIIGREPYYRCRGCNKRLHCYWDGNDNEMGTDYCNNCDGKIKNNMVSG